MLLVWLCIGTGLRLTHLAAKPPWTDEFSTLVFSLGNSFLSVPLNQVISLDVLLQPLKPNPAVGVAAVIQHLLTESNHPPLYFVLAHWWMQLWHPDSLGLASVWAARALPALFGAASIPAVYGLGWLTFRSRLVGQIAAAIMAVSPYGIFLAQEARHYTLSILWVIASLSCLVIATKYLHHRKFLPIWVAATWIGINILGIATHYFFVLTLCAEAVALLAILITTPLPPALWRRIYLVAVGTALGCLVWLPVFLQSYHSGQLTDWIQNSDKNALAIISPVFQLLAAWITMLSLLPVEAAMLLVVMASGLVMLIFLIWALPIIYHGLKVLWHQPQTGLMTRLFSRVVGSATAFFLFFTYFLHIDLTRGARYNFVYFPAVIVLLGGSLAVGWEKGTRGKKAVTAIWLMGLLSGLTVVSNLGYQKYYRPDILVSLIQKASHSPVLIATTYKTHVQTGEMMGIAREFKLATTATPQFLLIPQGQNPDTVTKTLQQTLKAQPQPLDLWLVNFHAPFQIDSCIADTQPSSWVNGYDYKHYHCTNQ